MLTDVVGGKSYGMTFEMCGVFTGKNPLKKGCAHSEKLIF